MKKKMAFVDLTNFKDWPMGGMLEYELAILPYIVQAFDVDIWGYSVNGVTPPPLVLNGKEYPIHICGNCETGKRIMPNFWRGMSLMKYKKDFWGKYDVVYAHTGSCAWALSHIIDKSKTKLVYQQHGLSFLSCYSLQILMQRPSYYFAQKNADLVLVVSDRKSTEAYAKKCSGIAKAKYVSVGSPIRLAVFDTEYCKKKNKEREGLPSEKFVYVGRLDKWKNPRLLVESFAMYVKKGHQNAVLNIAGSGVELDSLKEMKSCLNLEHNLNLLGPLPHDYVYNLLKESDVFLMASKGEGCSVSVLEAFASGLPVICGRMPGLEGQVEDHKTGLFVKNMDADGFYEAMEETNRCRYELAKNCMEEAQKYDQSRIAQKIIENINDLF